MRNFLPFILLVMLASCSKTVQRQKRLQGDWTVQIVRIEDGEGFMFYDSAAVGSFSFDQGVLSGQVNYRYSYFGQYDVSDSVEFNMANFSLSSDATYIQIARTTDTLQAKIIELTKKHLTFEYYDYLQYRLKRFSFTRN
ncbi:MAG: hypothetical protein ACK5A8_10260 [Flavobacteriia bacterium]